MGVTMITELTFGIGRGQPARSFGNLSPDLKYIVVHSLTPLKQKDLQPDLVQKLRKTGNDIICIACDPGKVSHLFVCNTQKQVNEMLNARYVVKHWSYGNTVVLTTCWESIVCSKK